MRECDKAGTADLTVEESLSCLISYNDEYSREPRDVTTSFDNFEFFNFFYFKEVQVRGNFGRQIQNTASEQVLLFAIN